ncbi:hypothetical protein [Mycoplasma sp. 1654_15]|uniref:hypothetical protein n=1 Tax=Mycoplasma sp. 1654_15 TaxID=2725994 RepID=UPI001449EC89|nr:hypothetical protein [Mycoplasma sp. 1654_15]QJB71087.1 hypothetical protein HF996_01070 [Mycoplasma sp. 1654_15]
MKNNTNPFNSQNFQNQNSKSTNRNTSFSNPFANKQNFQQGNTTQKSDSSLNSASDSRFKNQSPFNNFKQPNESEFIENSTQNLNNFQQPSKFSEQPYGGSDNFRSNPQNPQFPNQNHNNPNAQKPNQYGFPNQNYNGYNQTNPQFPNRNYNNPNPQNQPIPIPQNQQYSQFSNPQNPSFPNQNYKNPQQQNPQFPNQNYNNPNPQNQPIPNPQNQQYPQFPNPQNPSFSNQNYNNPQQQNPQFPNQNYNPANPNQYNVPNNNNYQNHPLQNYSTNPQSTIAPTQQYINNQQNTSNTTQGDVPKYFSVKQESQKWQKFLKFKPSKKKQLKKVDFQNSNAEFFKPFFSSESNFIYLEKGLGYNKINNISLHNFAKTILAGLETLYEEALRNNEVSIKEIKFRERPIIFAHNLISQKDIFKTFYRSFKHYKLETLWVKKTNRQENIDKETLKYWLEKNIVDGAEDKPILIFYFYNDPHSNKVILEIRNRFFYFLDQEFYETLSELSQQLIFESNYKKFAKLNKKDFEKNVLLDNQLANLVEEVKNKYSLNSQTESKVKTLLKIKLKESFFDIFTKLDFNIKKSSFSLLFSWIFLSFRKKYHFVIDAINLEDVKFYLRNKWKYTQLRSWDIFLILLDIYSKKSVFAATTNPSENYVQNILNINTQLPLQIFENFNFENVNFYYSQDETLINNNEKENLNISLDQQINYSPEIIDNFSSNIYIFLHLLEFINNKIEQEKIHYSKIFKSFLAKTQNTHYWEYSAYTVKDLHQLESRISSFRRIKFIDNILEPNQYFSNFLIFDYNKNSWENKLIISYNNVNKLCKISYWVRQANKEDKKFFKKLKKIIKSKK